MIYKHKQQPMQTQTIVYIVLIIIAILYVRSYYKYPHVTSILQTSSHQFSPNLLLEKQPVIIDSEDADIAIVRSRWFGLNIGTQLFSLLGSDMWLRNKYKYIMMQCGDEAAELFLCNPNTPIAADGAPVQSLETKVVGLTLSRGQIVILPFHWSYIISPGGRVDCIGLNDLVTYFL